MSCAPMRLPPPNKVWKSFTSKLQIKLHRSIKKKTTTPNQSFPWLVFRPSKLLRLRRRWKSQLFKATLTRRLFLRKSKLILKRKRGPVYVDKLFKEKVDGAEEEKGVKRSEDAKRVEGEGAGEEGRCADEMWETLAMASPLMHGIDDRAEHFIARVRADMEVQHILAPYL